MPTQDEALKAIGQHEVLKVHDDGDMTVKDANGCLHVVSTDGETFTEQSCECLNAMANVEMSCPVSALPIYEKPETQAPDVPEVTAMVEKNMRGTWMKDYPENTAYRSLTDGELNQRRKAYPKYANDLTEDQKRDVAAIYREQYRRYAIARVAEKTETREAYAEVEKQGVWPDGTIFPQDGQKVSAVVPGLFGLPTPVEGVAHRTKDGKWYVEVTTASAAGNRRPSLSPMWTPILEQAQPNPGPSSPAPQTCKVAIAEHGLKAVSQQSKEILDIVTAGVLASDETSKKWDSKRGFMPLVVEYVGPSKLGAIYSLAHYYEQQGDLMRDPEMEFIKGPDGNYYPISFWQDNPPVREEVVEWDDKSGGVINVNRRQQASEAHFANTWLGNIKQQQDIKGEGGQQHGHDIQNTEPGGTGSGGAEVSQGVLPERVPGDEEGRAEGVLPPQVQCSTPPCRDVGEQQRYEPGAGVESGGSQHHTGEGERLGQSLPTVIPRDVVLTPESDIGATAGAASRFDANLDALRIMKLLDAEARHATPEEQSVLVKYSGFGDSAFEGAFKPHRGSEDIWKRRGDQLRELTTTEEYQAIERSRLNAFYTTPEVINATWQALQQFGANSLSHPRVLEPSAGSGRFFGFQPTEIAARSRRTAVELDKITGRMLKEMYPNAEVYVMGYEQAPIAPESIDIAISNVPFGNYPVFDPSFKKERLKFTKSIHNYYFAKTLDQLRPGGMLAFITSHFTLDAPTAKPIREALAEQADLIGAIRLPEGAFPDTSVVTDIIFMRKRQPGETPGDSSWVNTNEIKLCESEEEKCEYPVKVDVNRYFLDHPEMVLGRQSVTGTRYSGEDYTVKSRPGQSLASGLADSIMRMPQNVLTDVPTQAQTCSMPMAKGLLASREGSFVIADDGATVMVQKRGRLIESHLRVADMQRVREMLAIRDAARATLNIQLCDGKEELPKKLETLNEVYNAFVVKNGPLNSARNAELMRDDPDGPFLRALEKWDVDKWDRKTANKMKAITVVPENEVDALKTVIFSRRVVHGIGEREERSMTTDVDAMAVVLNETGRLDFKRMAALLGKTDEQVRAGLAAKRLIFKNPVGDWELADKYLSGDVRDKLRTAEACATANPVLCAANVESLKAVQPSDLPPSQISVRLGVPWIPSEDVDTFIAELFDIPRSRREPLFEYIAATGEWKQLYKRIRRGYYAKEGEWGTSRMSPEYIILHILNSKPIEVNDKVLDKSVRNEKETIAAQDKATLIQNAFKEWVWKDPERSIRLAKVYNNTFNSTRPRIFSGAHQELPGMASNWYKKLHGHQKDAIWRVVQDRTALLGHEVGFGKSAVMYAGGMELRRLGLSRKNVYVAPKSTYGRFYKEFKEVYPFANILFAGDDDFTSARRTEFISRAVTGDWDAIILSNEQFRRIPVKPETELKFLQDEVAAFRMALEAEEESGGQRSASHKEIQKALARIEERIAETQAKIGEVQEHTMYFEDMGIDQLFVDEADMYKNLKFATRMGRVKGVPNSKSQRAWDMYQKCRYLQQQGSGQGVVFATGTPVANTIAEMYTMMRYLQEPMLESLGLQQFDAWAKTFGEMTDALEQTVAGKYRMTQRFAKFVNTPELSNLWQQAADIRVADEVPEVVRLRPRLVDEQGKERRIIISAPPDDALLGYMEKLGERAMHLPQDKSIDNMLKIASDANMASLDMRMVDPKAPPNLNGKIALASQKIAQIYKETMNDKGTQLVFLDLGTPKANDKAEEAEGEAEEQGETVEETAEEEQVLRNVYKVVRQNLLSSGVPENEIAFIHDAKTTSQRNRLYDKVNSGDIRVIIGSTGKLGTGVNVQERAAALHHLDCPWRPRDIEQREGRIIRVGNKVYGPRIDAEGRVLDPGLGVRIYAYVTERSFDSYKWQAVESKSRAIKSIMRRENPPRVIEDIDSFTMSAGEAKAIASGNPEVLKALTLKNEVNRLQMLRASHLDTVVRAREQVQALPGQIDQLRLNISKIEQDTRLAESTGAFRMTVGSRAFSERPQAGEALADAVQHSQVADNPKDAVAIGQYKGFTMRALSLGGIVPGWKIFIQNPNTGLVYATTTIQELTPAGVLQRVDNTVANIPVMLEQERRDLERSEANLKTYKAQIDTPFGYAERLSARETELNRLEKKLQGHPIGGEPVVEEAEIEEGPLPEFPAKAREEIRAEPTKKEFVEPYEPPLSGAEVIEQVHRGAEEAMKGLRPMTPSAIDEDEHKVTEFKTDKGEYITLVRAGPQKGKWRFTVAGIPRIADSPIEAYDAIQELVTRPKPQAIIKELWAMTREEFAASQHKPADDRYVQQQRDSIVKQALASGKPVPSAVLAEYPELTKGRHILYTPEPQKPFRVSISREGQQVLEPIKGTAVMLNDNIEGFVHRPWAKEGIKESIGWMVSDTETGLSFISGPKNTQADAIKAANDYIASAAKRSGSTPQQIVKTARTQRKAAHPELYGGMVKVAEVKAEPAPEPLRVAAEKPQGDRTLDKYFFQYAEGQLRGKTVDEIAAWYVQNLVLKNQGYLEYLQKEYHLPSDVLKIHERIVELAKVEQPEEIKVGLDILKQPPKVSPLKGKTLTSVRSITDEPGQPSMRVPLDEVEVTHPMPGQNAFWYNGKRIILTPEQEQSVSVKPTEPTPKAPKAEPPTPPRRRTFVAVKAAAPVAPVGELICTAAAKDILPKPKRIFVAVPKKERKWVAATDLVCTVNVKQ